MSQGIVFPVDLKEKVTSIGTQGAFADRLGVNRMHFGRILNGLKSIQFPLALECTKIFGSITVQYDGLEYELRIKQDGDDPERELAATDDTDEGMTPVEATLAASKEMKDVLAMVDRIPEKIRHIANGNAKGTKCLANTTKELHEADFAIGVCLAAIKNQHPEAWELGMKLAVEEMAAIKQQASVA